MKKVVIELSGIFIFLIGFIFMINSFSGITGHVINNKINTEFSSMGGIIFIIVGLILFIIGRHTIESNVIFVNHKKGIRKIKFSFASKMINYDKLKKLTKEAGYKFVETKDYAAVFSKRDEIIKNDYQYPIVIPYDKKNDKQLLLKILRGIIKDYEKNHS